MPRKRSHCRKLLSAHRYRNAAISPKLLPPLAHSNSARRLLLFVGQPNAPCAPQLLTHLNKLPLPVIWSKHGDNYSGYKCYRRRLTCHVPRAGVLRPRGRYSIEAGACTRELAHPHELVMVRVCVFCSGVNWAESCANIGRAFTVVSLMEVDTSLLLWRVMKCKDHLMHLVCCTLIGCECQNNSKFNPGTTRILKFWTIEEI